MRRECVAKQHQLTQEQDKQVSVASHETIHWIVSFGRVIATFQIPQLFSTIAWNLSGAKHIAFTMAEILLSLTIIGVVAAITLPSLTGNINERTWNTQRKALYARISQAIALMPAINGYGTLIEGNDSTSAVDTSAETFVTEGLAKVLKINNICDSEHLPDCGITTSYTTMNGNNKTMPKTMSELNSKFTYVSYDAYGYVSAGSNKIIDTKASAFETQNGESIILFYNPSCVANMEETQNHFSQPKVCLNMIYDLNGSKGPNTVGKDIGFMTVLYPSDSVVVAPMPYNSTFDRVSATDAASYCKNAGDYRIPTKEELASLFLNKYLINGSDSSSSTSHWWSSSKVTAINHSDGHSFVIPWIMQALIGEYRIAPESSLESSGYSVLCVQR